MVVVVTGTLSKGLCLRKARHDVWKFTCFGHPLGYFYLKGGANFQASGYKELAWKLDVGPCKQNAEINHHEISKESPETSLFLSLKQLGLPLLLKRLFFFMISLNLSLADVFPHPTSSVFWRETHPKRYLGNLVVLGHDEKDRSDLKSI